MNTDIEDVDPFAEDPDSNPLPQEHDPTPDNAEDQGHDVPISDHHPDDDQPAVAAPTAGPTRRIRDIPLPDPIVITDALKTTEGASSTYIAYVIRSQHGEARRRYSEFEALRNALVALYPIFIIPPLPPKHSLGDYAVKQSKAKEDANVIARRKRMLAAFLNRVARHSVVGEDKTFNRFLDGNVTWAEMTHSPPLTSIPKNPLRAPCLNPTDTSSQALYSSLPLPSAGQQLQNPDQRFVDSEIFTAKFSSHLTGSVEKVNRRLMKRWAELSSDYADLGALLNGFSLSESGELGTAIEKVGQAVDGSYVSTNHMLQEWERTVTEPLYEYGQFSNIIKSLLKYRHQKHLQWEMIGEVLEGKRMQLDELERSEREAQRLEAALEGRVRVLGDEGEIESERGSERGNNSPPGTAGGDAQNESAAGPRPPPKPSSPGAHTGSIQQQLKKPGAYGFLGALSHTFHGIVDVNPEATRRNTIGKTRDSIAQLEEGIDSVGQDLRLASVSIQSDLDRFQRQKVADIRALCLSFARFHREWCLKNLEQWEEAKREIEKIPDDPHLPGRDPEPQQ